MIIYGASGHGKVIAEILEENGVTNIVFVDDRAIGSDFLDYPLYQADKVHQLQEQDIIIAVGNNKIRKSIADKLSNRFGIAKHPASNLSTRSEVGVGTVVMAGVSVNSGSIIGRHVILNTNCSIDHDCLLEDYVHISPNAALAGNVTVGACTHIGIGACVVQGITIGKYVTIGAGSVIIKDIPDYAVVVGVPGKIIKYNSLV